MIMTVSLSITQQLTPEISQVINPYGALSFLLDVHSFKTAFHIFPKCGGHRSIATLHFKQPAFRPWKWISRPRDWYSRLEGGGRSAGCGERWDWLCGEHLAMWPGPACAWRPACADRLCGMHEEIFILMQGNFWVVGLAFRVVSIYVASYVYRNFFSKYSSLADINLLVAFM
jgi:hypothetical protein